ncbi:hypothetical protein [Oceanobacillus polygoni]|uniref:Uncharacterized protein n=1 Tax=Oceanobacillus polygoni TaxID=1235259 RepID=A0A9X0YWK2_9BACI|nr:hypothetical protein [Oceanobacillus polygoni]MBP2080117.1 hypothetical protein [Oceanobacillus polygoni]
MAVNNAIYIFRGNPFLQYIEVTKFKNDISSIFEVPKEVIGLPFQEYYAKLINDYPSYIQEIRKTFFENILYSQLKNVFVDRIESHPDLEVEKFKKV